MGTIKERITRGNPKLSHTVPSIGYGQIMRNMGAIRGVQAAGREVDGSAHLEDLFSDRKKSDRKPK